MFSRPMLEKKICPKSAVGVSILSLFLLSSWSARAADSLDFWKLNGKISGTVTFTDTKSGYGGGPISYSHAFSATSGDFVLIDSALPSFPEVPSQIWIQGLQISGQYTELDVGCCSASNPPQCCPQKFTGTISQSDNAASLVFTAEKNPLTNNLMLSLQLTPDINVTGSWTPKGCCIQQDVDPMTFSLTGGILVPAETCSAQAIPLSISFDDLRYLKKITRTFQHTLDPSCANIAGFTTYASNARLTWNATLEIDVIEYNPYTPPSPGAIVTYATAGTNGKITPSGVINVEGGSSKTFTITPDSGYRVADVLVDGVSIGAVGSYTFNDITKNHTIEAIFKRSTSLDLLLPLLLSNSQLRQLICTMEADLGCPLERLAKNSMVPEGSNKKVCAASPLD